MLLGQLVMAYDGFWNIGNCWLQSAETNQLWCGGGGGGQTNPTIS